MTKPESYPCPKGCGANLTKGRGVNLHLKRSCPNTDSWAAIKKRDGSPDKFRGRLPRKSLEAVDALVKAGLYTDRQDCIRDAVRVFLQTQAEPSSMACLPAEPSNVCTTGRHAIAVLPGSEGACNCGLIKVSITATDNPSIGYATGHPHA